MESIVYLYLEMPQQRVSLATHIPYKIANNVSEQDKKADSNMFCNRHGLICGNHNNGTLFLDEAA
ncbi:hypothetical protein [Shewanella sp. UCD-KL21]|uniref:hypothetical protein n=1 Tax=Shewanella sp. UCD-KL21 TaxID=1917164 RepID=UPI0011155826|nr:hypothetical protein [Shewanella sp. UCD-KL21]